MPSFQTPQKPASTRSVAVSIRLRKSILTKIDGIAEDMDMARSTVIAFILQDYARKYAAEGEKRGKRPDLFA